MNHRKPKTAKIILCGNFQVFVSMATVVRLKQISLKQLNWRTPKTPYLVQES